MQEKWVVATKILDQNQLFFFLRPAFAGRMSRLRGSSMPQIPGGQAPKPAAEPQEQHQQGPATRG
jgi:hypothetical protein